MPISCGPIPKRIFPSMSFAFARHRSSFRRNPRGAGWIFGDTVTDEFNHVNGINLICRAHQVAMEGYQFFFKNENCCTVCFFSSLPSLCRSGPAPTTATVPVTRPPFLELRMALPPLTERSSSPFGCKLRRKSNSLQTSSLPDICCKPYAFLEGTLSHIFFVIML